MTTISLFWDTGMAAVMSCENSRYQAYSQDLKSGHPKCTITSAKMNNSYFKKLCEKKWESTGCLDTCLVKSL